MIGWLSGVVRVRDPIAGLVVIDAGGVGYQVIVSWQTFAGIGQVGESCELWVHTHVREDALLLYGFASASERRMFQLLTSVPQVGPKNAVAVLGGFPLPDLIRAIADSDRAALERVPGVGKRTAERILLDLREKVEALGAEAGEAQTRATGDDDPLRTEARAVLINLGWKPKPVDAALDQAMKDDDKTLDAIVRRSLKALMAR